MKPSVIHKILAIAFLIGDVLGAIGQWTSYPQPMTEEGLLSALRKFNSVPAEERDNACEAFVIKQLGNKYSDEATALLVGYLDFERPIVVGEKTGFMFDGPLSIDNRYPATSTLMTFGRPVVPALLTSIGQSSSSLVQRNATYTLMQIFRNRPESGIQSLRETSLEVKPEIESQRLEGAARQALQWCGQSHLDACKSAENSPLAKDH